MVWRLILISTDRCLSVGTWNSYPTANQIWKWYHLIYALPPVTITIIPRLVFGAARTTQAKRDPTISKKPTENWGSLTSTCKKSYKFSKANTQLARKLEKHAKRRLRVPRISVGIWLITLTPAASNMMKPQISKRSSLNTITEIISLWNKRAHWIKWSSLMSEHPSSLKNARSLAVISN